MQSVAFQNSISNVEHTEACKIPFDLLKCYGNKMVCEDRISVFVVRLCHSAVLVAENAHRQLKQVA
jgi:hypothetical protein